MSAIDELVKSRRAKTIGADPVGFSDTGSAIDRLVKRGPLRREETPEEPGFFARNFPGTKETLSGLKDSITGIFKKDEDPDEVKPILGKLLEKERWDEAKDVFTDAWDRFQEQRQKEIESPPEGAVDRTAAGLETVAATSELVLTPVTALFTLADEVPVIDTIAKTITLPLAFAGDVGASGSGAALDSIPDNILSQESKDKLRPGLTEVVSLASQIYAGRAIHTGTKKFVELKNKYGEVEAKTIIEKAKELATKKKELDATKKQPEVPRYEEPVSERPTGQLKPVEGTGELRTRGLSRGIEEKAIERKLTKGFGELPEYERVNMIEQAGLANELIKADYERGKRIAMGEEIPPQNIIPEAVLVALEEHAIKNGDVVLLKDLATVSRLSTDATTMGQRIRTLAERNPESPVARIKEIKNVREANYEKGLKRKNLEKDKKAITKNIKDSIDKEIKRKLKKGDWETFVNEMIC